MNAQMMKEEINAVVVLADKEGGGGQIQARLDMSVLVSPSDHTGREQLMAEFDPDLTIDCGSDDHTRPSLSDERFCAQ